MAIELHARRPWRPRRRAPEHLDGEPYALGAEAMVETQALEIVVVCTRIARGRVRSVRGVQGQRQACHDAAGNLVLDGKDVAPAAIPGLRPEMRVGVRFDQLGRDADPLAGLADAALDDMTDAQSLGDRRDVHILALEGETRCPRRDTQARNPRQHAEQLFAQPVREILVVALGTHVGGGQHRDGLPRIDRVDALGRGQGGRRILIACHRRRVGAEQFVVFHRSGRNVQQARLRRRHQQEE